MRRIAAIAVMCTLFFGIAAASTDVAVTAIHDQLDKEPGLIGANHPMYGLETAIDNVAVSAGLMSAGDVARERAAEAKEAIDKYKPEAAARAAKALERVTESANGNDTDGIDRAMASLNASMQRMAERIENADENARQGQETALDSMQAAFDNMEKAKQRIQEAADSGPQDGEAAEQDGSQPDDERRDEGDADDADDADRNANRERGEGKKKGLDAD